MARVLRIKPVFLTKEGEELKVALSIHFLLLARMGQRELSKLIGKQFLKRN
jgi:hypothetical protein